MISDASLGDLLRNLGFTTTCVNRAIEELHGRPMPNAEYPPVDRAVYSITNEQIDEAAMYAARQANAAIERADIALDKLRQQMIEVRRIDERPDSSDCSGDEDGDFDFLEWDDCYRWELGS